jgi:DNA-binding transcriptional ArsR family regulator
MTIKGTNIRDFTSGAGRLEVEVVHGEVFETLSALYAIPDCVDDGTDYDDEKLITRISQRLDEDLSARVVDLEDSWSLYLGLMGIAYDRGVGQAMDDFIEVLRALDPLEFRRTVLGAAHPVSDDPTLLDAAARGEVDAVHAVLGEHHAGLRDFLLEEPATSTEQLIDVIERFHDQGMRPELEAIGPMLERDAAEKRALAKTLPAELFVERATKGVTFEPGPGVRGVVLIPSVVLRPWTLMVEHRSIRIFVYSVDEETINADPTAPPSYLVELYKALGDERRLRLLAELWVGDQDLKTLSHKLELAKSTVHHHLRTLRTAGLVRVIVRDEDKVYGIRKEALVDAGPLLEGFLNRLQPKE